MLDTDYAQLAAGYDEDRREFHGQPDPDLSAFVASRTTACEVLDLGCGTNGLTLVQMNWDTPAR